VLGRKDSGGDEFLVAYVVGAAGRQVDFRELRAHVAARLPTAMVPSAWVFLDALPRLPNGKVDRRVLPVPGPGIDATPASPPRGPFEQAMARIWGELLDRSRLGVHDNFFDLGGHSLLAIRLLARLRDLFGVDLTVRTVFEYPTISALAAEVARRRKHVEHTAMERILDELAHITDSDAVSHLQDPPV
jgi:aryl carrier-like protein